MNKQTNCGVLALAIHYFFIAQFSWMFAQVYTTYIDFFVFKRNVLCTVEDTSYVTEW